MIRRLLGRPRLSVIVIVYDMAREAPRTLASLALPYQRDIRPGDYEVIVMDNGSPAPLGEDMVRSFGPQFRYHYIADAKPSPAEAINRGVALSRGGITCIFIDGARIASPGMLAMALSAFRLHPDPVVATLGWHLGPDVQQKAVQSGYSRAEEDRLLDSIGWPADGYRLFEISVLAASSNRGYFATPSESNGLFLLRRTFHELGGYDTAFDLPGGGLLNLDFFSRALARRQSPLVMLLGEGTFHQMHGGASTGTPDEDGARFRGWADQYQRIRGRPWQPPHKPALYLGRLPAADRRTLQTSVEKM